MNVLAACAAFGLGAGGLLLVVRGLVGTTTPLEALAAELHRPRTDPADRSRSASLATWLAGRETPSRAADLAVCDRDLDRWVRDRCTWALLGGLPGLALSVLVATGVLVTPSLASALLIVVVGVAAGWMWARVDLAGDARNARRAFRHALSAYLQLVTILLAGGAGVETAMFDAADVGTGPALRLLRGALVAAQARREPPWRELGALGARLQISDLEELEAAMTLAGGGAQVRDSLTAKATAIAERDLAEIETAAQARSETLVLPVALMFAGFLILLGYPALAALSGS